MNKLTIKSLLVGTFFLATAAPSYAEVVNVPIQQQVNEVATHLVGAMDTSAQAKATPGAPNVRITTCKVQVQNAADVNRPDAVFLYQEQALTNKLELPYRQRFLRIAPTSNNLKIESAAFKPPTPKAWIGLCSQPETQRNVPRRDLGEFTCSVFLQRTGKNYVGETAPGGCPSNFRGAARITNRIILHQTGMDTLDRGYDAAGKQIWGAKEQPYQFRWLDAK